jgi:hypothetical protein
LLWHPEQKLWNRPLIAAIQSALTGRPKTAAFLCRSVIEVDSLVFVARALVRRARTLGALSLVGLPAPVAAVDVLYIDCGVHERGLEIRSMFSWFPPPWRLRVLAFEAGLRQYSAAKEALRDIPNLDLRHGALVGPDHDAPSVTLYNWSLLPNGEGDSLFAARGGTSETVPALRLSEVLQSSYAAHRGPVILRMNIEGAETLVIQDLIGADLIDLIDGFHGSWDDLSFIDKVKAECFRALLRRHGIAPLSFNGRDLHFPLRRFAIRLDAATSLARGVMRKAAPAQGGAPGVSEQVVRTERGGGISA